MLSFSKTLPDRGLKWQKRAAFLRLYREECFAYLLFLIILIAIFSPKCDTRRHMTDLLVRASKILEKNGVQYWLDKGTLLGVYRDKGLIPWEYDVDLGVMNETCDAISKLKLEFLTSDLIAYDRNDQISHKVKLTYDTERRHFYWSDAKIHDPCIRIYDLRDTSAWIDIYWYIEEAAFDVKVLGSRILIPPNYDGRDRLLCTSEGLEEYTDTMCCGGCVARSVVFPIKTQRVLLEKNIYSFPVPNSMSDMLRIQYGAASLKKRKIKGWKRVVCGYWESPILYFVQLFLFFGILMVVRVFLHRNLPRSSAYRKRWRFYLWGTFSILIVSLMTIVYGLV